MKKKAPLKLLTPLKKTMFLGKHSSQRASYLLLPDNYQEDLLHHDVKNGAKFYAACEELSNQNFSNYSIITAKTMEDGYRAVLYLAAKKAVEQHHDEKPEEFEPFDTFDLEDFDYVQYDEHFSRIPIIPLREIESYNTTLDSSAFEGPFMMDMKKRQTDNVPWWLDCESESVCIVQDSLSSGFMTFMNATLNDDAITNLSRFQENAHVYLLVVGDNISPDDYSINRAMLEYTAACYHLPDASADSHEYHYQLFQALIQQYQLKFSKNIDIRLLSEKLERIDYDYPCATYEKTLKYLLQSGVKSPILPQAFASMGLSRIINTETKHQQNPDTENTLFGMDTVKSQLENIMNALRYNKMREKNHLKPLDYHKTFLFVGAPGTAKTTMAQLLADQMAKEGFLQGNRFVSVNGAQLKAPYLGQTTSLVHTLFEENDAILIDEAYSLTSSMHGECDSYGQEALAQLAIELEKHSKDKLIIFSGYGGKKVSRDHNKMLQFIEANPGIKSRINTTIYFDSYAPDTMVQIVHHLASISGLTVADDCDPLIRSYFEKRVQFSDFGNGREARSLLEQCQVFLANRLMTSHGRKELSDTSVNDSIILKEDVSRTVEALSEMNGQQQGVSSRFGYLSR